MLHTLGTAKGEGQNISIAHYGSFQRDKRVKFGIILTKLKLTKPSKMLKPCLCCFLSCIHNVSTFQIALFHSLLLRMHLH